MSQALLADDYNGALASSSTRFQSIFGRDSFFVELQDHGLPEQLQVNPQLIRLARDMRAPLLATNDSHYTHRDDAEAHDALLCVQTGAMRDDPKRFKFDADEFYLKTAAEMRDLFSDYEEACDNTLLIAERANVEIEFGNSVLPTFPTPAGSRRRLLPARARASRARRSATASRPAPTCSSASSSSSASSRRWGSPRTSSSCGTSYRYARTRGIRVGPGRGSAAGSCVAYCLRIVDIDPIRYDLLFERFLNPGRKQMPDIDMDFDSRYRGEMIKYAAERYGVGPRRADRHLLHHQGAGRGARLRAGARLPVRGRRQDRQAHAAARSWAATRRCARASRRSTATTTATRWRPSCARSTTPTPTPSASSTSPAGSRGCAARTASTPPRS